MIKDDAKDWLAQRYPGLVPSDDLVAGTIGFTAVYDTDANRFTIVEESSTEDLPGVRLCCEYSIRIAERTIRTNSNLPAVHVDGVDPIPERHFCREDHSACLCSPLIEDEFLLPNLNFPKFLEELVIPFLYGQEFYSRERHWPWEEYGHGITGLLESYATTTTADIRMIDNLLRILSQQIQWPRLRECLQQNVVRRHTMCFCDRPDLIRRCHPQALAGLRLLLSRIQQLSIPLP